MRNFLDSMVVDEIRSEIIDHNWQQMSTRSIIIDSAGYAQVGIEPGSCSVRAAFVWQRLAKPDENVQSVEGEMIIRLAKRMNP
jgi:hypothetical protein